MRLLEHMDRTEKGLTDKLRQAEFSPEAVEDAIAYVKSYGYINDARYARTYISFRIESRSRQKILTELQMKGVDRQTALEAWEEMELRIHARQFWECFLLTLIPALALSLWLSWWWMILPFIAYHLFYWFEKMFFPHSVFDWEALTFCGDAMYLRKRKSFAWMKWYGKKTLPASEWDD